MSAAQVSLSADSALAASSVPASQQVAAALASLSSGVSAGTDGPGAAASSAPAAPASAMPGSVRTTLDGGREAVIKLDPDHLGSVSIRLKMTGGRVDVAITVSDPRTLDVLDRDRHLLTAAVSGSGAPGGGLTLSHGETGPASASGPSFSGGDPGTEGRQASGRDAAASGDSSGRRRDGRDGAGTLSRDVGPDDAVPSPAPARPGALYV